MGMEKEQQELQQQNHIFRSPLPDIYIPYHLPIHAFCFENLENHHSHPALINAQTGQVFTHSDVNIISRRLAAGLHHKHGIRQGDVIMIVLHNSPEFVFSFLASSFLGAITTTANPNYASQELISQAKISKPALIITNALCIEKVDEYASKNGVKIISVDDHFSELIKYNENLLPNVEFSPDDTAMLPFSSGTTGLPKGVMLSHKNVVACVARKVDGENPAIYVDGKDLTLCVLPLFHVFSLMAVLLSGLRVGSTVLIVPKYETNELMGLIKKYGVTIAPLVPPILLAMRNAGKKVDMSSVRRVMSGAAPMDEKLESSVRAMFPNAVIGQGYGMTEAGVLTTCLGFAKRPLKFKPGSCGTAIRNSEMKIIDTSTGVSLPRNKTGEICVRNEQIMKGYLNDPEATKRMIDNDGWLHSGDIGYVDDDDQVYIVDRLKELIKYKGFHVAPAQLEALLIAHANISDAAVVPMKDEVAGEVPVAFVVRSNGSNISEQEIKKYISKQVVSYKRLSRVFFISQIPKAPSGKILRKNLRAKI